MTWFTQNKDLVAIVLAVMAIIVSLVTVLLSRRQQQLSAFLQIQETMFSPDLQYGRRLIYRAGRGAAVPEGDTPELHAIARALAVFNLLGVYVRRRVVPPRWVLDYWHTRLRALRLGHDAVVSQRVGWSQGRAPWPDLLDLIDRAERYRCQRLCCATTLARRRPPWQRRV